jgi:alpha-glucosidase
MVTARHAVIAICLAITCNDAQTAPVAQQAPATRRSQRVQMTALDVQSPDGQVTFKILPNAERVTFSVALGNTTVIEPSPIVMTLDGYDLSAGVVFGGVARDAVHERYPWSGVRSTAISDSNRARLSLTNDLTSIAYTLEVRAFDDGVAYRHIIPGDAAVARVPDEWSTFNLPEGSVLWYAGMAEGHYEAPYVKADVAAVQPGEWAGPPLTFKLPQNRGYASITEANLVNYSGMGLESNGRGGWVIGLGHRQPLN